jgi:hypothetical protein
MKVKFASVVCVLCSIVAVALFVLVTIQQPFPIYGSSNQNSSYVSATEDVGAEDSRFMWTNDGLALIAQAFVLFAAAAAALGLLRKEDGENHA